MLADLNLEETGTPEPRMIYYENYIYWLKEAYPPQYGYASKNLTIFTVLCYIIPVAFRVFALNAIFPFLEQKC